MHTSFIVRTLEDATVTQAPSPARPLADATDLEALFEEARLHRRRRYTRIAAIGAALLVAASAAGGAYKLSATGSTAAQRSGAPLAASVARKVSTVVFLVDVSGSMQSTDVGPTRLAATVAAIRTFIERLPAGVRLGLVSFNNKALILQPPTIVRTAILSKLDRLYPGGGTALGIGLATAINVTLRSLKEQGVTPEAGHYLPAVIMLESDGAQNVGSTTPLQAARRARTLGIRIDGVALGTANGAVKFGFGNNTNSVPVPPDPQTVRVVSQVTGGQAFTATTASRLRAIYRRLGTAISH
jgi:Ca-activated chloride channel family protein